MRSALALCAIAALVVALGLCPPAPAAAARNCVGDEGASARAAGDPGGSGEDGDPVATFSTRRITITD
jgi:hypothetical protein